tara:strand:+ start:18 stop:464 length:447 start_codon:yes stop_codon:yes gene_type:complete
MLFFIKLLPVLLLVGGGAYGYHTVKVNEMSATIAQKESAIVILKSNEEKLIAAEEQNRKAIETMKQNMEQQREAFTNLSTQHAQLAKERDEYMSVFRKHDLTKLARRKPGLIEPRINNGTAQVFRQVEQDSREVDQADDVVEIKNEKD